jgi:hypothetical protein
MFKSISIFTASLALLLATACSDTVAEHYKTYNEAISAGAAKRGWLPSFVPTTANEIDLIHDLDTNHQWLHFKVNVESAASVTKNMHVISLSEIKKEEIIKPKGIEWPVEFGLDEIMFVTPRASLRFFSTCSSKDCLCIAHDSSTGDIFGWTCRVSNK